MQDTFHGVIAFALLAGLLVIGSILRNRIPLFRTMLIPSSIIGGMLGFTLLSMGWFPGYQPSDFTSLTFHFFTLSFMSLCLTGTSRDASLSGGSIMRGGMWLTIIWTISLGLQGVLGYLVIRGYDAITGAGISAWLGAIVTHGFTQGPGQALTYGSLWEGEYGIEHAAQVGLIFASVGFLVAFAVGVPLAKRFISRGLNANKVSRLDETFRSGFYPGERSPITGRMVSHPASLDSLAYHLGLLAVAYVITHVWLVFMQGVVAGAEPGGINLGVLFSHNLFFLHGLGVCVLMRLVIDKVGLSHRVDDESLKRITGSSVDFMVVGTLMSIQFSVLYALLAPIILVAIAVTVATFILCLFIGRLSGKLGYERVLTSFGCCCGSTGTGLLLLRMMDADFSTSVPKELAFFNLAIIISTFHILFIFAPLVPSLGGWGYLAVFGGTALLFVAAIPLMLFRRPSSKTGEVETKGAAS
ncbi:sodium/glutamate symporter [Halomonas heilongjiangensis]|uniref:Sodium:glutamate symporter n=1 Tax=Halomonas heilongjiangensis TaxID=1387883 RepID=A0A2N7TGN8_9GAMM|nr:sodium/glutamate symporter [Halomonas heilongjiangensis]PMR67350.1 sodium:glutamate symporter [Halomonas heilongjiangensis]PXX88126.1 sodium:glutamate symporter [Halomonas heilongjiangensis]